MHFLLVYEVGPEYLERRAEFRNEHLALAWEAHTRGELLLGGALAEPVDTALLLFQGDSPAAAERFAAADPYVLHGLVRHWRVRPWITVAGAQAATPAHPGP
ncbi:MAG: YciI-like protein [Geothrix sp.]|nr:YciI-like protein [Geothrix sp.]